MSQHERPATVHEPAGGLGLVLAKLHRPPQDQMQAAVVLEAWAGKKAPNSFDVAAEGFDTSSVGDEPPAPAPAVEPGARLSDFSILVAIVASAIVWMPLIKPALGSSLETVVSLALPAALVLDGVVRIRHLSAGNARSLHPTILGQNVGLISVLWILALTRSPMAVVIALTVLWGQANILNVRGWYGAYVGLITVTGVVLWQTPWDIATVVIAASAMLALTTWAVLSDDGPRRRPEPISAAVAAGVVGGSSGMMLVADPSVWTAAGWPTTTAVLLVTFTGWMASARLTRIWLDLPARLARAPIVPIAKGARKRWRPAVGNAVGEAVLAASVRVVVPTVVALVGYVIADVERGIVTVSAFTMFALATLATSLNVATRRWTATALVSALGAATTFLVPNTMSGLPLLCGSALILVVAGALALVTFKDATVAFSTRMLIR